MRIALYSAFFHSYEVLRYAETARRIGHELLVIPYQSLIFSVGGKKGIDVRVGWNVDNYRQIVDKNGLALDLVDRDVDLANFDVVLTRSANRDGQPMRASYNVLLQSYYDERGIPMLNGSTSMIHISNKLWQHRLLTDAGLPVAKTRFIAHEELLESGVSDLPFPLFTKGPSGTHGEGARSVKDLSALHAAYGELKQSAYLLIQEDLKTRADIRALVLGDEVLGAIQRTAAEGADISNFSGGGSAEEVELTAEEKDLVVRANKAIGTDFSGVDLMYSSQDMPYILETNRNPQFYAFESEVDVDVPEAVIEYMVNQRTTA